jgi:thiamine kinase-like enzyme
VKESDPFINAGVLLMDFIPGTPFIYDRDYLSAADIFACIHQLPVSESLLFQNDSINDILNESKKLITIYEKHTLKTIAQKLLHYFDYIQNLHEKYGYLFLSQRCIVNTEVNSGNFIVNDSKVYLVDWEKAVISSPYQDLAHFLVATTTLWKTDKVFTIDEKNSFLDTYRTVSGLNESLETIIEQTRIMEKVILLRALSWCYMAYYEYSKTDRSLKNEFTFKKIKNYLENIDWFLS